MLPGLLAAGYIVEIEPEFREVGAVDFACLPSVGVKGYDTEMAAWGCEGD